MRRFILIILFALYPIRYTLYPPTTLAANEFNTKLETQVRIDPQGFATITNTFILTNLQANTYATQYSLQVSSTRLDNVIAYDNQGNSLPVKTSADGNKTTMTVGFPDAVVGKGKTRSFSIKYVNHDAAQKVGRILELTVPKLADPSAINDYQVKLIVPTLFGQPKIVNPNTYTVASGDKVLELTFSDSHPTGGITALFGDYQVLEYKFDYHLQNPTVSRGLTQIALPPDTPYQKVYLNQLEPQPKNVASDLDGNWIATYELEPSQEITVTATGAVLLYLEPSVDIPDTQTKLTQYLLPQKYWPTRDPEIKKQAQSLASPQAMYDYIVANFTYDYQRLQTNPGRLGGKEALANPSSAICTEFTDAFITLSRSAGIPAREINGYAYTQNPKLKPLSLVQDTLHSWPEYFDTVRNSWIPIDPTWGNTTGGIDYFSKLDFNHFTLAIHGTSDAKPLPAGYYKKPGQETKDLTFNFNSKAPEETADFAVNVSKPHFLSWFSPKIKYTLTIKSYSNVAYYNYPISLSSSTINLASMPNHPTNLLPFSLVSFPIELEANSTKGNHADLIITINQKAYTKELTLPPPLLRWPQNILILLVGIIALVIARVARRLLVSKRHR